MEGTASGEGTRWQQVAGIAAVLVALGIGWTAYGTCQPRILVAYGLGGLATALAIVQGVLGIVLEPLVGALADRLLSRTGRRFVVIALSVTVAGVVFVAVAAVLRAAPPQAARTVIPPLMIAWLTAVTAIRAPTILLLKQAASASDLPRAAAVLALVSGVTAGIGPYVVALIDRLGDSPLFIAGGVVLALAALSLRRVVPYHAYVPAAVVEEAPIAPLRVLLAFVVGTGVALLLRATSDALVPALPVSVATGQALWAFVPAILAPAAGELAKVRGATRVFAIGLLLGALAAVGLPIATNARVLVLLVSALAMLSSAAIAGSAVALMLAVPARHAGLTVGAYFGGFSAAALIATFARPMLSPTATAAVQALAGAMGALSLLPLLMKRRPEEIAAAAAVVAGE